MDYGAMLIWLVIFGVVSFFIEKALGVNPYQAYSAIGAVTLVISALYLIQPIGDPDGLVLFSERLATWMTNVLPGAVIGDAAGVIIAKVTSR